MVTLDQNNEMAWEVEVCEDCGDEQDSLNTCPYCGTAVCDDCLAEHEEDEGEHDDKDEEE